MSKRKSAADLRRGINVPKRRPSVTNMSIRVMNVIQRKPGATNVRFTSGYKAARNYVDTQRSSSNAPDAQESSDTRNGTNKIPKTRFNSASGSNARTSRLKNFPMETVRKIAAVSCSYSPPLTRKSADQDICEKIPSLPMDRNAHTWAINLPSHGYGDTLKSCLTDELSQQAQQGEQHSQRSKKTVTISQQHLPSEPGVGKINQSEATLNRRVSLHGQPVHRPFVPKAAHGMMVETSSVHKAAISPRLLPQQSCTLREQVSLTTVEQTQRPQVPLCHQVSQIFRRSGADQSNRTASTAFRNAIPWKTDHTSAVYDYEIQPIDGGNLMTRGRVSDLDESPADTQRQVCATGPLPNSGQVRCDRANPQQQRQSLNGQTFANMQTIQNVQQMHQQLQNDIIRQQEMEQRPLHQQQQMMPMTKQRIRQQPLPQHLKTTAVPQVRINLEPSCGNLYDQQQYHSEQLPSSTRDIHTNKGNIPHYRMLMQQQNPGFRSFQTSPPHGWVPNQRVISDRPSLRGQITPFEVNLVSSNNMKRDGQLKAAESPPTANQPMTQQPVGTQWQQGTQCSQYEAAMRLQYRPIQLTPQNPNLMSRQKYLSVQQDQQASKVQPEAPMTNNFPQTQQLQQQQKPHTTEKFDPSKPHRLSQTSKNQYPKFTVEMIRDQELLVANLRQQKIPENVMRRQFDALLSEQRRHLAFLDEQNLAEKVNETPPHIRSRTLHVDQRPDWMGNITPARMTVQPVRNSRNSSNQLGIERDGKGPTAPEQLGQLDQREQKVFEHVLDDLQHSPTLPNPTQNPNRQGVYHSWQPLVANQQYVTALPTSPPYANASLPQVLPPPHQNTFSWSQQNGLQLNPQYHSVQSNDLQAQCHRRLAEQQPFQRRCQQCQHCQQLSPMNYKLQANQLQRRQEIQQEKSITCLQTQREEDVTPEQYQQHEKIMLQAVKGNWGNNSKLSQNQYGTGCKPDGPSSLLKLREFQRYIRPQMQNNGLQDAETVLAALKALKGAETKKGLEYVAELGQKMTVLKLNGTQDPSQLEKIPPPPAEYLQRMREWQQPKISSNGLCNTRNANNPAPPPISFQKAVDGSPSVGYPRQYYPSEKLRENIMVQENTRKIMAEKENGSVASAMRELDFPGTVFPGCEQATVRYLPSQTTVRGLYPQHHQQLGPTDGRCQQLIMLRRAKSPIELQRVIPIMPYKFDASESLYQRQMDQFYRNRLNLKNFGESKIPPLKQGSGTSNETALAPQVLQLASLGNTVQPKASDTHNQQNNRPNYNHNHEQEFSPPEEMVNHTVKSHCCTQVAENEKAVASDPTLHQASTGTNCHGQPEIREPKTFGGLTYLARKVGYLRNPPITAPNTFVSSKFLQPSADFS